MMFTLPERTLLQLSEFAAVHFALNFPRERWDDLERNISNAAKESGYTEVEKFIHYIITTPMTHEHVEILAAHLTVNETYFWREPGTFEALEKDILPELVRLRKEDKKIRIWSAGCSSGEEPYSIAIALHRAIPHIEDWNITILATDINPRIIQKAAIGVYHQWSFRNSPLWFKEKYFLRKEEDKFEIVPEIKRMVKFEYLNLADDKFPSALNDTDAMDVIFCRNVFIYFTENLRSRVARGLFKSLLHHGYLVVSASELSLQCLSGFTPVNFPGMVFFQKGAKNLNVTPRIPAAIPVPEPMVFSLPLGPVNIIEELEQYRRKNESAILHGTTLPARIDSMDDGAKASYARGSYPEIIGKIQKGDQSSEERILLIREYANRGNLDRALRSCEKAIAADKLDPGLHYLYATILQENNQMDEAVTSLKRAIFLDSNFVLSHYSLGKIYQRLGNDKSAAKCNENVMTILNSYGRDEILFASEGLTAGRFRELINTAHQTRDRS